MNYTLTYFWKVRSGSVYVKRVVPRAVTVVPNIDQKWCNVFSISINLLLSIEMPNIYILLPEEFHENKAKEHR